MPFLNHLKANSDIFEYLRNIDIPHNYVMTPIFVEALDSEAMFYWYNCQDDGVKKYLPGAYVATEEDAKVKLNEYIQRMILHNGILYSIRSIRDKYPLGYIMVNSPISSTGLNEWTIDFWLNKQSRGKGLMTAAISNLLQYFQQMDIEEVYALVDADNTSSLKILNYFEFEMKETEKGGKRLVYRLRLIN